MDDLWQPLFDRLAIALRRPENLVTLLAAVERVQNDTGYGTVSMEIDARRIVQVNETVKRKPRNLIETRVES